MNRRLLTILLIAFVIAAVCTVLVYRLVQSKVSVRPPATTSVVAAKVDIKLGTVLKAEDLTSIEIAGTPPAGVILEKDKANAIDRGVISDLYAGEPIIENRLAAKGMGGGLAAAIPQGMRACAVRVDEVVGVSGFATPGMHVDVLIAGTPPGTPNPQQGTVSRTLLQNIEVLSAGTEIGRDPEGKPKPVQVVNLLVTPEQAETLSLATNQVTIRLVLRNPLDTKTEPVPGTATANLFADPNAAPVKAPVKRASAPKPAAPPQFSIEVINGKTSSEEKFATPGGRQ
ncbi:MAG: Flp pilus assembly protein CpaB [Terracidiphilus sp.]|jgi:pilus assembly protein CpaB